MQIYLCHDVSAQAVEASGVGTEPEGATSEQQEPEVEETAEEDPAAAAEVQPGDSSMLQLPPDKGTSRLEAALQARNGGVPSVLAVKPKGKAKSKAQAKKAVSLKRPASKSDAAKQTNKSAASVLKKPAQMSKPLSCKKPSTRELKMTRECVYSRAYHGAKSSLATYLPSSIDI